MTAAASRSAEWMERMRDVLVLDAAVELGFDQEAARASNAQRRGLPCPACNAQRRHTKTRDKRGAAGLRRDGRGWHCFQCDASGDALDFVALHRGGKRWRELAESGKADVRTWCMRWLGLESSGSGPRQMQRPSRPFQPTPEPPPQYPPIAEVDALWSSCMRVTEVPEVDTWLRSKRIDPQAVADRDIARAMHPDAHAGLPKLARYRAQDGSLSSWAHGGYLLIAQLVDAQGAVRSVLARNVRGDDPKSRAATGFERRGLVLACSLVREVLATGQRPSWWPVELPLRFEVCEGEKKWSMRIAERSDAAENAPGVIGIESGSWTDELAARIPDGSSVFIATDCNNAGALYATRIVRSLESRVRSKAVRVELRREFSIHHDANTKGGLTVRVRSP